ncbi:aminotransferase class V-fold PLP-dependent enzyme, partial [Christensenellaceae bacterium OttesenSCG-928-M15]|nr:aminotransferase class V-fold PLP-dependent enzyme [Christensenellaceae bacterium OttesenSCG-928-M15]
LRAHEMALCSAFMEGLREAAKVRIVGPLDAIKRVGVVSLNFIGEDNAKIASRLEQEHGILTRVGLHCSPMAHKTLGTFPHGTVRFSFGFRNTMEEILYTLNAIKTVAL